MPSSHLILCRPLLLLPPIPPSIRVFSSESTLRMRWPKYWSFSFSIILSKEMLICNCSSAFDQNHEVTYSHYLVYSTQQARIKPGKKHVFPLRCPEYFGPRSLSSDSLRLRLLFLPFPAPHSLRLPEQTVESELCLILPKDKGGV